MKKIKKNGKDPVNARINIKYTEDKPKIRFSYPDKKSQFKGSMLSGIFLIWVSIVIIGVVFGIIFGLFSGDTLDITYEKTAIEKYTECVIDYPDLVKSNYSEVRYNLCKQEDIINKNILTRGFLVYAFLMGFPYLIYYPFKKKWDKLYPKWQGFMATKKLRIFKKEDIIERENRIFVELPVFSNVVLDFKCKGDFAKHLEEIDIREHKFVTYKKRKIKIGKKKVKKRKVNEFIWYARWYFNKKPIKGNLEVIYK